MTDAVVFIGTSLDGYIARTDGGIGWLDEGWVMPEGDDMGYGAFVADVDAIVMGRATYEVVAGLDPWPYDRPVVVLSRSLDRVRPDADVRLKAGDADGIAREAAALGWDRLYVDGGQVVTQFLAAGLVAEMTITRLPILLGGGIRLFGALPHDIRWEHLGTRTWPNGFVQSRYRRAD